MSIFIETIGYAAAFCFVVCGLPQLVETFKKKTAEGLSLSFLLLWLAGEILMLIYIVLTSCQTPVVLNLVLNTIVVLGIIFGYWKYRKR